MATIMESITVEERIARQQAELHNAQIKERYRRLQNAEADQFAQSYTQESNAAQYTVRASVLAPEKPVYSTPSVQETPIVEQVPQITEYVREKIENPVFTTEKFQSAQQTPVMETAAAPVMEIAVAPVTHTASAVAAEPQYSLSRAAKIAMAAFGTTAYAHFYRYQFGYHPSKNRTAQRVGTRQSGTPYAKCRVGRTFANR